MFENSKDVLNLTLAFCALWLAFFLSWLLFYVIMIVKNAHELVKNIKAKLDLAATVLTAVKEKIDDSANTLSILVQSVGKIVAYVMEKQTAPKRSRK